MLKNTLKLARIVSRSSGYKMAVSTRSWNMGRSFHVYKKGDISSDLLITLSMNQDSKVFQTHDELVENLIKKSFLRTRESIDSFRLLDRGMFNAFHMTDDDETAYIDKPYNIGHSEKMTSPMMHAIAIELLAESVKEILHNKSGNNDIKFLDVGTGSGYMAFLLSNVVASILEETGETSKNIEIKGIDIHNNFFTTLKKIESILSRTKKVLTRDDTKVVFENGDFLKMISQPEEQGKYHLIHAGVGISRDQFEKAKKLLNRDNAVIVAPVIEEDLEQSLRVCTVKDGNEKEELVMRVVFSPIKDLAEAERISKYFLNEDEKVEEDETEDKTSSTDGTSTLSFGELKAVLNEDSLEGLELKTKSIEDKISEWQNDFKSKHGNKPSLKDMKDNQAISSSLEQLRELKRKVTILKRKANTQNTKS